MQLHIAFDDELLLEYNNKGSELVFEIYFENEGKFYPQEHWTDFGEVILNWWAYQLTQYYENYECLELMFMDGNYTLTFDEEFIGKTSIEELSKLVSDAINKLNDKKYELRLKAENS